ncbi:hypothetical protein GALMADRAFT_228118 [Galerina marginata CBS 339.88]|uniref:F-box domain-containing protein n=1 Tax=Galerina marginata (strain CBS 339.88) TaxID=685588 RepID=A0A067T3R4_GALM3|nr:hypothetical protein GALMADRAFT_228118 [Galerina marginata CBS 339.88]
MAEGILDETSDLLLVYSEHANVEDHFLIIDQKAEKYKKHIVALWKLRNNFAPISRLPAELLCKIFHFSSQDTTRGPLHWIKVSHVCHAWRNIAINYPSLWTNLPLRNVRWMQEMLSRSKMASLTVDANFSSPYPSQRPPIEVVSSVLCHLSRIRDLSLVGIDVTVMKKFLPHFHQPAPALETLCLHVTPPRRFPLDLDNCEIPETLLSESDRLRRLDVSGCQINWYSRSWKSLTVLKIHNTSPTSKPTATQLWDALKRMSNLQYLDLDDFASTAGDFLEHREKISLAHLRKLKISSSTAGVQMFFQGVSFPSTVNVYTECKATPASGADFTGVLSAITSSFLPSAQSSKMNIHTLEVSGPTPTFKGLRFATYLKSNTASKCEENDSLVPDFELLLGGPTVKAEHDNILMDVCAAISLGELVRLLLKQNTLFKSRTLVQAFGSLPRLMYVHVDGLIAEEFASALQEVRPNRPNHDSKSHLPGLYFASLRSLSMSNVHFDAGLSPDALYDCLESRSKRGAEMQKLKLEQCHRIPEDGVGLLEEIVDVDWDGLELGYEDLYSDYDPYCESDYSLW